MNKRFAILILPFILISIALFYRLKYPKPPVVIRPATETNAKYIKLQQEWLTNVFTPLFGASDILSNITLIPVIGRNYKINEPLLSTLHSAIERIVRSLLATNFDHYLSLRSFGHSHALCENSLVNQRGVLSRFYSVNNPPTDPIEAHKLYWSTITENGKRSQFWASVSWKASWVEYELRTNLNIHLLTSTGSFFEGLIGLVPNCGIVGYPSSFNYSPDAKSVFSKDGRILVSLMYMLVKNIEGKAYPIIVQFYWAPSAQTWFPTHLAVGYVGSRQLDPVF